MKKVLVFTSSMKNREAEIRLARQNEFVRFKIKKERTFDGRLIGVTRLKEGGSMNEINQELVRIGIYPDKK